MSDPFAEAALLMADSRYALGREYSAPLGETTAGRLEMLRGAAHLTVRDGADPSMLFQARFGSPMAEVVEERGTVRVIYHRHGGAAKREKNAGAILLNASVPWAITCNYGVAWLRANLRQVKLTSLSVSYGVSDVEIDLGAPSNIVPITIGGGVSQIVIRRPRGMAARLQVKGGAAHVTFDQHYFEASGGKMVLATPDIDLATERYEIDISGGVSGVKVITFDEASDQAR